LSRGTTLETLHEILGRRFEGSERVRLHSGRLSFTIIGIWVERNDCYVHWSNGAKEHLNLREVMRLIRLGKLIESEGPPFVWPRDDRKVDKGV